MAEIRTLKLNLLADTASFKKGLKGANKAADGFAGNLGKAAKIGAAAFTVAGAAVAKFAFDAAKAAAEDEASTKKYEKALKNTTKATDKQIKASEEWITNQQFAYGISDSKLRPAIERLARSTKDITKAQKLANLAMDISAGTGKDLEAVSGALGKAYDGNFGALKKLGIPLDDNIIKTKNFDAATKVLSDTFGGQASVAAGTFEGQLRIANERIGEFKESIGAKLLPYLSSALTAVMKVADGFGGKTGLAKHVGEASDALSAARDEKYENSWESVGKSLKNAADQMVLLFQAINGPDGQAGKNSVKTIADSLESAANAINSIRTGWEKLPAPLRSWMTSRNKVASFWGSIGDAVNGKRALGGPVTGGGSYLVGERGPEIFTPRSSGSISANGSGGNTFVFNGVVDGESARRSIERLFQQSSRVSGPASFTGALS
jgi:hypothetical protein